MVGTRPCKARVGVGSKGASQLTKVGSILTEARSRLGINVQMAARDLRIPEKHLRALEEGDLSVFAAEIYAKGAFTKYAQYLGVHAQTTQHAFQRVLSQVREFVPLRVHTPKPWLVAIMTPAYVLAVALAGIALVVGAYVAWQVMTFVRLPELDVLSPAGVMVEGRSVVVQGKAGEDSVVLVNGKQALLGDGGGFEQKLYLHEGINVIQVSATNAAGRTRTVTRDVLVPKVEVVTP